MAKFPAHIRHAFPAFLTSSSVIDLKLLQQLQTSVSDSLGLEPFRKLLKKNHRRQYMRDRVRYLAQVKFLCGEQFRFAVDPSFQEFPVFEDPDGYGSFHPSAKYLTSVYIKYVLMHEKSMTVQIAKAPRVVLSVDHSFKVR